MTSENKITDATIEALSRNFFKEAATYGFKYEHYIKFVNVLLEQALNENGIIPKQSDEKSFLDDIAHTKMPICSEELSIRSYNKMNDFELVEEWLRDKYGKYFLHSLITSSKLTTKEFLSNEENLLGIISDNSGNEIGLVSYLNIDKKLT
jgi:hypothetical protein